MRRVLLLICSLPSVFKSIFKATRTTQDELIVRVRITLAHNFNGAKLYSFVKIRGAFPLHVIPITANILALHHLWMIRARPCATSNTIELWYR